METKREKYKNAKRRINHIKQKKENEWRTNRNNQIDKKKSKQWKNLHEF